MGDDGVPRATIFAEMSALAVAHGRGQPRPGLPRRRRPPSPLARAAADAIAAGVNQYPPGPGIPPLREAVAEHQDAPYGLTLDPDSQVLVTAGATEAIAATVLALASPGDEVRHPRAVLRLLRRGHRAGRRDARHGSAARHGRRVPARPGRAAAAFTPRTRLVLVNTPHNPTGTVLTRDELAAIAALAVEHDALVVTDEVYEHLVLDGSGAVHLPIATLPGMAERTLTISSAGKTFSFTGWKIGWVTGPAPLVTAVRTVKQFLTYVNGAPFQPAVAFALRDPDVAAWVVELAVSLSKRRDLLCGGLEDAGFTVVRPQGTYFVLADAAPLGYDDGAALCRDLPGLAGVVGVPVTAFTHAGSDVDTALRSWVRFTFVKREEVLAQAVAGLHRLHRAIRLAASGQPASHPR